MTESLQVDTPVMRVAAGRLSGAADEVPAIMVLDLGDCGSVAVAAAADRFSDRARVASQLTVARLNDLARSAVTAAAVFEQADSTLATDAISVK